MYVIFGINEYYNYVNISVILNQMRGYVIL